MVMKYFLQFDNQNQSFLAGLGWDKDQKASSELFNKNNDLDLCCYLFSKDYRYIDFISPSDPKTSKYRFEILHTGDHKTGDAGGEDEEFHINLKRLNNDIQYIAFTVQAKGILLFDDVKKPYCKFMDGATFQTFLNINLQDYVNTKDSLGEHKNLQFLTAYLMRVPSDNLDGDDWYLCSVEKFVDAEKVNSGQSDFFKVRDIIKES